MGRSSRQKRRGGETRPEAASAPSQSTNTGESHPSRTWLILAAIVVIGLLLRISYLSEIIDSPEFTSPTADAAFHDYWARGLATGEWPRSDSGFDPRIAEVPYLRPPAYPYFLALTYKLTGGSYIGARVVQMALGLVNCVLAFLLGRSLFRESIGLILAGLCACYWAFIFFEGELQATTLLITLSLILMLVAHAWSIRPRLLTSLGTGLLIGLLALVRANVVLFLPIGVAWMLWAGRKRRLTGRRAVFHSVSLLAGAIIAISPATLRNAVVADDFVLISCNGAVNLYIGNNPTSDGVTSRIPDLFELSGQANWSWFSYDRIVRGVSQREGGEMRYSEVSSYFTRRAMRHIAENPGQFAGLCLKRAGLFWGPAEISNNRAIHVDKASSATLHLLPPFPVLLSVSLVGLALLLHDRAAKRRDERSSSNHSMQGGATLIFVALFIATYFISFVPFLAAGRFRVPVLPLVFVFGAYGVHRMIVFAAARSTPRLSGALTAWLVMFGLCSLPLGGQGPDLAWWHTDRGDAYVRQGKLDLAATEFELALSSNPGYVDANIKYAEILAKLGRLDEAIARYRTVLTHRTGRTDIQLSLGLILLDANRFGEAVVELEAVAKANPGMADAHYALGWARFGAEDYEPAVEAFEKTLQLDPSRPEGHNNLGSALSRLGRTDEALEHYRLAIQLRPDFVSALFNLGVALRGAEADEEATDAFVRVLEMEPDHVAAIINLAGIDADRGRYDEAIAGYRKAVHIDPRHMLARCNLAGALANSGRYGHAIDELEEALRVDPKHPIVLQRLEMLRTFVHEAGAGSG